MNWERRGSTEMVDLNGKAYALGQRVAKASMSGRSCFVEVREVTAIKNGKVYLGKAPLNYPGRNLILD